MLIYERQERLLDILRQRRAAQLEDLARELGVSLSTARRDVEHLESRGLVERTHGGAVFRGEAQGPGAPAVGRPAMSGAALATRMGERVAAKQAIGRYAASLIKPQMTVLFDGGSTVIYAAQQVAARPIQVVTNSLAIAGLFHDDERVELVLAGGMLYPRTGVTVGPIAVGTLAELHADLLLFSLAGVYEDDAYNINLTMAQTEQAMLRQAARRVLLMDSSKFGQKSLSRVCALQEVDQVVTDDGVDEAWRRRLGAKLVVVGS
jgi:DeoR/GlpR family transcriptional regulator of sugar metabolism